MDSWRTLINDLAYTDGGGYVLDKYDVEKIALFAYVEGMQKHNDLLREWLDSDEVDRKGMEILVNEHITKLREEFNIKDDGRKFPLDGSV